MMGTSAAPMSAVKRDSLGNWCGERTEFERRQRLQEETLNEIGAFSAGDRLAREHVHRRGEFH